MILVADAGMPVESVRDGKSVAKLFGAVVTVGLVSGSRMSKEENRFFFGFNELSRTLNVDRLSLGHCRTRREGDDDDDERVGGNEANPT